jgi:lysophospholipase L1-like esterase
MKTRRICVFGDSIVWGAFDEEQSGWVQRVQQQLTKDRIPAEVYNLGICGQGILHLVKRMRAECVARQPQTVVIAIGVNDASYWNEPSHGMQEATFTRGISEAIGLARSCTSDVVVVGLTPADERLTHPTAMYPTLHYTNERISRFNECARSSALEEGIPFVDVLGAIDIATDISDGLHPNAAGHRKICELVVAQLTAK